jgi:hypothetical protein
MFSLNPRVVDRAIKVPDLASIAAMFFLRSLKINAGPATGISFIGALSIAAKEKTRPLRIASFLADTNLPYESTYYKTSWIDKQMHPHGGVETLLCWVQVIQQCFQNGKDPLEIGHKKCPSPSQHEIEDLLDSS